MNNKGREKSKKGRKRREEKNNNTLKYKNMCREGEARILTGDERKKIGWLILI
jgi:hypothetical protein